MKRRQFILSALGTAGALVVGWGVMPVRGRQGGRESLPVRDGEIGLNGWIKVAADGAAILAMNRSEMGQGVHTALPMLVAEELDLPLGRVRLEQAGHDAIYGNVAMFLATLLQHPAHTDAGRDGPLLRTSAWMVSKFARELGLNATGASSSVTDAWEVLRLAAATARAQLLGAAALQWRLPVGELRIVDGTIEHASGQRAHFGELARQAAALSVLNVRLKDRKDWTLIGRPAPRTDVPAKVNGSAAFGVDVRPPGMVFAAMRHCPMFGGSPGPVDVAGALRMPGVERVVKLGPCAGSTAGVAVVARTSWHALRAAQALQVEWHPPPHDPRQGLVDSSAILETLRRTALEAQESGGGLPFLSQGDVARAEAGAARRVEAVYQAPYLAHAAMEPINCTAQVRDGQVTLWVPTQVPGLARQTAAEVAGVAVERVTVHVTLLGGGFGRRLETDVIGQAVRVAMETGGRPVQLLWSREEDFQHDFYRPAAVAVMRATLDKAGRVASLRVTGAGDAITPRWLGRNLPLLSTRLDLPDKATAEGLFELPYDVPNQRVAHVAVRSGVPIGYWRSVGHSHNAFFAESFIDELAHEAGRDPVAFRLGLLRRRPLHVAVLKRAAAQAQWDKPLPAGRARGVAVHESFGSVVAQVLEVSLVSGRPRVHKVVCAVDCGLVVNPEIVAQQMEGAVIFGLSAALHGRIDIERGVVRQRNFPDYPLMRLPESPVIEIHLLDSTRAPGGVGEIGTPPVAPALANALFALTGRRLRELPLVL